MKSQWTLSMTYFTAIDHVVYDNFVFQQDIALVYIMRATQSNCWSANFTYGNYGRPLSSSVANPTHIILGIHALASL